MANPINYTLLRKQLAALERLNDNDAGDIVPRKDGDHDLLLGLENMVSEILHERTKRV